MAPVFNSGAFIQQCFAVHPLCLSLKKLALPDHIILSCSNCRLAHRLTIRSLTIRTPMAGTGPEAAAPAADRLQQCAAEHGTAIRLRAVDVVQETAGLRCAECRRLYELDVAAFDTHMKDPVER